MTFCGLIDRSRRNLSFWIKIRALTHRRYASKKFSPTPKMTACGVPTEDHACIVVVYPIEWDHIYVNYVVISQKVIVPFKTLHRHFRSSTPCVGLILKTYSCQKCTEFQWGMKLTPKIWHQLDPTPKLDWPKPLLPLMEVDVEFFPVWRIGKWFLLDWLHILGGRWLELLNDGNLALRLPVHPQGRILGNCKLQIS